MALFDAPVETLVTFCQHNVTIREGEEAGRGWQWMAAFLRANEAERAQAVQSWAAGQRVALRSATDQTDAALAQLIEAVQPQPPRAERRAAARSGNGGKAVAKAT